MSKVRVSVVPYLNARPFVLGIEQAGLLQDIDLRFEQPAEGAKALMDGIADIALAPVALIPRMSQYFIVSEFGIACDGEVGSVGVCANSTIESLTSIQLDPNSMTSNELLRILLREYWHIDPNLTEGIAGKPALTTSEGALLIGSRSLSHRNEFTHFYDLGEAWKLYTGYPFVFALWMATREPDSEFVERFSAALRFGIMHISDLHLSEAERHYLQHQIKYELDERMMSGLDLFLSKLR